MPLSSKQSEKSLEITDKTEESESKRVKNNNTVEMETDEPVPDDDAKSDTADSDADSEKHKSAALLKTSASTNEDDTSTVIAPRPISSMAPDTKSRQSLKWNLRVLLSNMYMKTEQRLPSARVPKCLHNTALCMSKHRCSMLPDAPGISVAQELRNNLYNQHYDTYLDMLVTMTIQSVYPDEEVFDRLFDMIMILTTKSLTMDELQSIYKNVRRIFYLLLDAFPPCWTALRPYYLHFLGVDNASADKPQKLKLLMNLLEDCLAKCTEDELKEFTSYSEVFNHDYDEEAQMSEESVFLRHVQDYDWQNSSKQWLDDFKKMSPGVRLARVCDALDIICWVLEREFMSWLDHNKLEQNEPDMFQDDTKPFVLIVFGWKPETRLTDMTRQVLRLYSRGAAKSLHADRLYILQRFVSLIMEASNTAELRYVEWNSVIYPELGPETVRLIAEFFRLFKAENPKHISTYINTIPLLQLPYVRFKFADHFLQLFYFSNLPFRPAKICEEFRMKQWLRYKPRSSIDDDVADEQLSREDYNRIMMNALQDYCLWMNLEPFWKFMKTKIPIQPLQGRTSSPLATPVGVVTSGEVGKIFMLDEMQKEAHTWKDRINVKAIVHKPKVNLPVARVSVSNMAERYGNDIRQLRYLRRVLHEVMRIVDVTEWLNYLDDFLGEDEVPETATSANSDN